MFSYNRSKNILAFAAMNIFFEVVSCGHPFNFWLELSLLNFCDRLRVGEVSNHLCIVKILCSLLQELGVLLRLMQLLKYYFRLIIIIVSSIGNALLDLTIKLTITLTLRWYFGWKWPTFSVHLFNGLQFNGVKFTIRSKPTQEPVLNPSYPRGL